MSAPSAHTFQHEAMATFFEVTLVGEHPRDYLRHAALAAFREADRLENELSRYLESSYISRANRLARGASLIVSPDVIEVLLLSADIAVATRRAFDPAYASERPADLDPDLPPFTLDPANFTLTSLAPRLHLDLGAVGKGFALDRMLDTLREWQIEAALLNAGGSSLLAHGTPAPDAPGWVVGVGDGAAERTIALRDASLSGSGIAVKGEHLVDPRTGTAAPRRTRTWACAPSAAQADALSTAFFVMTAPEVAALCTAHPQVGAALSSAADELEIYGALRALVAAAEA